ncbi:MAG: hypothetical protein ACRD4Y_00120 [Candidatus Acidiferrales bacterium]
MTRNEISARCGVIEECYEFMLAFAGQGLTGREGTHTTGQLRDFLDRAATALTGLAEAFAAAVKDENLQPADRFLAFQPILGRDASDSLAAIELVLAQKAISSQLIDNLNASIHLRALLTDLFLIDEIFKPHPADTEPIIED